MFPIIMLSQHPDASVLSCQIPKMCNYQLEMIMYKMPYATIFIPTELCRRGERIQRYSVVSQVCISAVKERSTYITFASM